MFITRKTRRKRTLKQKQKEKTRQDETRRRCSEQREETRRRSWWKEAEITIHSSIKYNVGQIELTQVTLIDSRALFYMPSIPCLPRCQVSLSRRWLSCYCWKRMTTVEDVSCLAIQQAIQQTNTTTTRGYKLQRLNNGTREEWFLHLPVQASLRCSLLPQGFTVLSNVLNVHSPVDEKRDSPSLSNQRESHTRKGTEEGLNKFLEDTEKHARRSKVNRRSSPLYSEETWGTFTSSKMRGLRNEKGDRKSMDEVARSKTSTDRSSSLQLLLESWSTTTEQTWSLDIWLRRKRHSHPDIVMRMQTTRSSQRAKYF